MINKENVRLQLNRTASLNRDIRKKQFQFFACQQSIFVKLGYTLSIES